MSHWSAHPAVRTGPQLTLGERAADWMKKVMATWTALGGVLGFMALWMATRGFGIDPMPYILLNLALSCLAALQCFILLIAAKRDDQRTAERSLHALEIAQRTEAKLDQLLTKSE